jgi:hypothetical protein
MAGGDAATDAGGLPPGSSRCAVWYCKPHWSINCLTCMSRCTASGACLLGARTRAMTGPA